MSEKTILVQGGKLKCKFSLEPKTDTLKVKSHNNEYANDKDGTKKLIASTKDIGQTLEKNTFGKCKLQPNGSGDYLPCQCVIQKWSNYYEGVVLNNKGKILTEDSKATCPIGGPDCIEVSDHGQKASGSSQNAKNANKDVQTQLNPLVDLNNMDDKEKNEGLIGVLV